MSIKPIFETVEQVKKGIDNLSVDDLKKELERDDLLLIDIREIQEHVDLGTIPGATLASRGMLEFWADPASPYYRDYFTEDKRIIVFCAGGGRSAFAAQALKDMGYADVGHLEEGFTGWAKAGEPVEETASSSRWMRKPKEARPSVWIGHMVMPVADVAASKAFCMELGMRDVLPDATEIGILELRGGTHLILSSAETPVEPEAGAPFDLMVEDVDAAHADYSAKDLQPSAIQDGRIHRSFTVTEPGGHVITVNSTHVSDLPV